ncbi:MAG: hypothetical protein BZY88_11365 [SAR202 cluster bacterium Io17-Chloro-G9]|nr:MAG: hypothetical protein BZY88_11365 [SAR202 cluster bacterium Io17-Chloro-G9]
MRIPKLAILVTLSVLMLSLTAGASSPAPSGQAVEGLFGTVSSVSPGPELTLITVEGESGPVEISVTNETQVRIPGQIQAAASDLNAGDAVAVRAAPDNDSGTLALSILVRPDRPVRTSHFTGVITSLGEDGAVGIRDRQGNEIAATLLAEIPDLRPGEVVTAALDQDLQSESLLITGLDRATGTLARIQAALEHAEQAQAADVLATLTGRLAENGAHHLTILDDAAQRVAPSLRAQVRQEKDSVQSAYADALTRFRAGPPSMQVTGTVTDIDGLRQRLTIDSRDLASTEIAVNSESSIKFRGRALQFRDLDLGNRVIARYDLTTGAAVWITVLAGELLAPELGGVLLPMALSGEIAGTVIVVDPLGTGPETITIEDRITGRQMELIVGEESLLLPGDGLDETSSLLELQVEASFDPESLAIIKLEELNLEPDQTTISGVVHSFIAKGLPDNFSVLTGPGEVKTISHTAGTVIHRDGRQVSISEVRVGDLVQPSTRFHDAGAGQVLVSLNLKSPGASSIKGAIQGIAESPQGEGRVTIFSTRSDLLTVSITTDTQLTRQGQLVGEAELAVGQRVVNGTYDPISGEAFTLMLEPPRTQRLRGEITAIDEERMAVTITPRQGDPVELLVLESTPARITLRGTPSPRLSDLQVGDQVRIALYDPETSQAYRLVVT